MAFVKKTSKKSGLPPGTLVHVGRHRKDPISISVIDYTPESIHEFQPKTIDEVFPLKETTSITWINVDGLHDISIIEKIGKCFEIHPLVLEDILNTEQRPKIEDYTSYLYIVLKMMHFSPATEKVVTEQISLVVGSNYVISFQETAGDVFNIIRDRLRENKGRIRKVGSDYLAYALIDAIVDNYFSILEIFAEHIESIEEVVLENPSPETLQSIHEIKRDLIYLRKSTWPMRELINGLQRSESILIQESTNIFLRDVYDHVIQVIDSIESYRDIVSGMLDIYMSSISNKMNEVMKVLTIFAAIFIPLTFIAGIYGMNFHHMPELSMEWGYPFILLVMMVVGVGLLLFFHRKKWL